MMMLINYYSKPLDGYEVRYDLLQCTVPGILSFYSPWAGDRIVPEWIGQKRTPK